MTSVQRLNHCSTSSSDSIDFGGSSENHRLSSGVIHESWPLAKIMFARTAVASKSCDSSSVEGDVVCVNIDALRGITYFAMSSQSDSQVAR